MSGTTAADWEYFKEQVRSATDLAGLVRESGVALKPGGGGRLKACCPFHHEKTPSFFVNEDAYHCFGCGVHGDCFSFLMQRDGLTFREALETLANRAGIPLPEKFSRGGGEAAAPKDQRERVLAANEFAFKAYYQALRAEKDPGAAAARAYLDKRGLRETARADWGIGYAPDGWDFLGAAAGHPPVRDLDDAGLLSKNDKGRTYDRFRGRIMFPIRDANGKTVAFSGRILPEKDDGRTGKYVNSPETVVFKKAKVLFGLDRAREAIRESGTALLCEGQIDTIRLHLCGFANAVAPQGTAFTAEQAHVLKRYAQNVVLVLDGDSAGHKAALRDAGILLEMELPPAIVTLPAGEDPDSFLLAHGAEAFRELLGRTISPVRFLLGTFETNTLQGVTAAKNALFVLLGHVRSEAVLDFSLREAAGILGLSLGALSCEMERFRTEAARNEQRAQAFRDQAAAEMADAEAMQLLEERRNGEMLSEETGAEPPRRAGRRVATAVPSHVVELARFLCAPPRPSAQLLGEMLDLIRYDLVESVVYRNVIRAFLENPDHWREEIQGSEEEAAASEALADRLIVETGPVVSESDKARAAHDLLARLWIPYLEVRRRQVATPAERVAIGLDIRALRKNPPDLSVVAKYFGE